MIDILSRYSIHSNTMALLRAKHTDYDTMVKETNRMLYIKQTPIELIRQACLERFITYEGVRDAVGHHTGFKRKVPIPIDPYLNIYFFPTHATNHDDCCWISYHHVHRIEEHRTNYPSSTILFKNGESLQVHVSPYSLNTQMERTFQCVNGYFDLQKNSAVHC